MGSVNVNNPNIDLTVKIFVRFYGYEQDVNAVDYDAVLSYFISVFGNDQAAANFTVTVFRIAFLSKVPVMDLLQQFQGLTAPEITVSLAYYLNGIRSPSTLLGINVPTQPNYYVARNIKA
jgi:pyruvate/2-oxoacid:ferredoxin oxidoreductase alpha subunit